MHRTRGTPFELKHQHPGRKTTRGEETGNDDGNGPEDAAPIVDRSGPSEMNRRNSRGFRQDGYGLTRIKG